MAAQGDMLQCRFGSHGDYSIIALCPSSVQEMFTLTAQAFNLADRYRVPVFVMADEIVGHMREKITVPDRVENVPRRELEKGVMPFYPEYDLVPGFATFGKGHGVHVTGLTHDERGYPCATNVRLHHNLVKRLVDKVENARHDVADYDIINPDAEQVFIAYGAPVRTVQQVLHDNPDKNVGFLRIRTVWPFPEFALAQFKNARRFLVPELNFGQMAREIERLAVDSRSGKLRPDDVGGSTFTVTSLGALGGIFATPVINYPEVAILGVHRIRPTPVARDGQVVVRDVMHLSLTSDHRVVDGDEAAAFVYEVIRYLEDPSLLFLRMA
jgi:pyruvate/2-oxoacid:ferredoxin oxidoreductase alpha subunit